MPALPSSLLPRRGRSLRTAERAALLVRLVREHSELAVHRPDGGEALRFLRVEDTDGSDLVVRSSDQQALAWRHGDHATGTCGLGRVNFALSGVPVPLTGEAGLVRCVVPEVVELLCKREEFRTPPLDEHATLQLDGGQARAPRLPVVDVSPHGIGVRMAKEAVLRPNQQLIDSILHLKQGQALKCPMVVRWVRHDRAGLEFHSPDPAVLRPLRAYVVASQVRNHRH